MSRYYILVLREYGNSSEDEAADHVHQECRPWKTTLHLALSTWHLPHGTYQISQGTSNGTTGHHKKDLTQHRLR